MTRQEIKEKIMALAEEILGTTLNEEETLKENGVDSLSLVSMVLSIEVIFGVSFLDDDLQPENLSSLSALIDLVEKYV